MSDGISAAYRAQQRDFAMEDTLVADWPRDADAVDQRLLELATRYREAADLRDAAKRHLADSERHAQLLYAEYRAGTRLLRRLQEERIVAAHKAVPEVDA